MNTKPEDIRKSVAHMAEALQKIRNAAGVALGTRPAKPGMAWIHLSKALADIRALCPTPATDAAYFTPKVALDAIAGERPLDAMLANPPFAGNGEPASPEAAAREGMQKILSIPELGIHFMRHRSAAMTQLVATWRNDFIDHIYEVRIVRDGESPNAGWRARATNDGRLVFSLAAHCRSTCELCALSAMKRYIKRGHRKTYRKLRAAAEEAAK